MNSTSFILTSAAILAAVFSIIAQIKGRLSLRLVSLAATIVLMFALGWSFGAGAANLRNYDQFVWRFSQYSQHLRGLAERQEIGQLTNDVVLFDRRFNRAQDPNDLQDVVFQILKLGKYYEDQAATNSTRDALNGK